MISADHTIFSDFYDIMQHHHNCFTSKLVILGVLRLQCNLVFLRNK